MSATDIGPAPSFDCLPLCPEVRRAVDELGFEAPTPVQCAVYDPAVRGLDLVVQARTGTGKTAAFGLPMLNSLVRRSSNEVQALVLCPTRELAQQVTGELESLGKYRGIHVVSLYGGAAMAGQLHKLEQGPQVVVGTPGRVLDHLRRGTLRPAGVRLLVLDECDEMLSMGFLPQINEVLSYLPDTRQTLLFSATLPPDIRQMAETRLRNPEFLTLSGDHIGALEVQHFVYWSYGDKLEDLVRLLEVEQPESAIVFANTREQTKRVAQALAEHGYAADWLNADLSQTEREQVMARTRRGELRLLVATDVAARGIDISHLSHVINFDFPESPEVYVHRTGRTGRAGRAGTAISLVTPQDVGSLYLLRLTYAIRPLERQLPTAGELRTQAEAAMLASLAQVLLSRPVQPDNLALARRLLTHDQADLIVAGLLRDRLGDRLAAGGGSDEPEKPSVSSSSAVRDSAEARSPGRRRSRGKQPDSARPGRSSAELMACACESLRLPGPVSSVVAPGSHEAKPPGRTGGKKPAPPATEGTPSQGAGSHSGLASGKAADHIDATGDGPTRAGRPAAEPSAGCSAGTDSLPDTAGPASPREELEVPGSLTSNLAEVYVNLGRRNGIKPEDLRSTLEARGLGAEEIAFVRVRHRHTFVGVRASALDRAVLALNGITMAGKILTAEPARRSAARTEGDGLVPADPSSSQRSEQWNPSEDR